MKKFIFIIISYLLLDAIVLDVLEIHKLSLLSVLFICLSGILYSILITYMPKIARQIFNGFFIVLTFFLTFGNAYYFIIKGEIFTVSQLSLLDELVGVLDTVVGLLKVQYLLVLLLPVVLIYFTNKQLAKELPSFRKRHISIVIGLLLVINVIFYSQNDVLYKTIYSPVEYAKQYGLISFYARDLTPFTKVNLDNVELGNEAEVTEDNEYTGMFEDKTNIVFIKAESFDDIAIDKELTPTLNKMATDGMFFENYYSLSNNTNASEFSTLTSLHPPVDNSKVGNYAGNYDTIPDLFNNAGYCTFGFHYNSSDYYDRGQLYSDLYNFEYSYFEEDFDPNITESINRDELLFESSIKYIEEKNCDKNFTYYMSIYGHSNYDVTERPTIGDDFDKVKALYPNNDDYLNSYLAFQMSLDQMAEEMIDYYTEQGLIDDTLFVVVGDHYPYALGDPTREVGQFSEDYFEQSFTGEPYEKYNIPLFIYDPQTKLENNTSYVSNVDTLPTIADLFDFDYVYSEGESAFDPDRAGVIKWYAYESFGMLSKDFSYEARDDNFDNEAELKEDEMYAAKLYSLFEK